jgi:hypothetical protein
MNITPRQMDDLAQLKIDLERSEESNPTRQALMSLWDKKCRALCAADPENEKYFINNIDSWTERFKARIEAGYPDSLEAEEARNTDEYREKEKIRFGLQAAIEEEEQKEKEAEQLKTLDPETIAVSAFDKKRTPIDWVSEISRDIRLQWDDNHKSERKAYIFACFSEIAYLKYTRYDLPIDTRYKVVPSETLENLRALNMDYNLENVLKKLNGGEGITVTNNDPGRGFSYSTFKTRYFVVVAVRGTVPTSIRDVLIDINFLHNEEGYHRGFYNEAQTAMAELKAQKFLIEAQEEGLPVYFTGHSLGAAIAWIFRHIWGTSHRVMTPYIYAPPRIGTNAVSGLCDVFAYTRTNDPVPHLPPMTLSFEDPLNGEKVDDESNERMWKKFAKVIKNHAIERYRVELGKKTGDEKFDPDVYFTALFAEMIDSYRILGQPFPFAFRAEEP